MNAGGLATLYTWLLFAHVLAATIWVGGAIVIAVLVSSVIREGDPAAVARFSATLRTVGPFLLAPATVATVGFGVWMVVQSAAWDFSQRWVQLGLGLFAAAFLIGAAHQSRAAIRAERSAADGRAEDALRHLKRWAWGYAFIIALLLAALRDMTAKPGL